MVRANPLPHTLKRRGFILPVVFAVVILVMLAVLLLNRVASQGRAQLLQHERLTRLELACQSAITEARCSVAASLSTTPTSWNPFYRALLPPNGSTTTSNQHVLMVPTASAAHETEGVLLYPVSVECEHVGASSSSYQGQLSFKADAAWVERGAELLHLHREERVRILLHRHPTLGLRVILVPGLAAARSQLR